MKYFVYIETSQIVEVDAETEAAAIELVKQKINYHPTDTTTIKIVKEVQFDEQENIEQSEIKE